MEKEKFKRQLERYLNDNPQIISRFATDNKSNANFKIKIGFARLIAECQIEINETPFGLQVLIHEDYPNKLMELGRKQRDFDILMALFFFHELTHLIEQNLGMKHNVTGIRSLLLEGEFCVLHFDIQADRKAVMLTNDMFPSLSEIQIADIQTRSLEDFPTVQGYSANSLIRKNRRFVSNRLHNVFPREGFLIEELKNPSNYLIASWGKTSTNDESDFEFHITLYGLMKYLGVAKISEEDNLFLDEITFECESSKDKFQKLDSLLERILSTLHLGGGSAYRRQSLGKAPKLQSLSSKNKQSKLAAKKLHKITI